MINTFINQLNHLSDDYSKNLPNLHLPKNSVMYKGKSYRLMGSHDQHYSFSQRVWLAICSVFQFLAQPLFSAEYNQSLREKWQTIWTGKQTVRVYCNEEVLDEASIQAHLLAKSQLGVAKDKQSPTRKTSRLTGDVQTTSTQLADMAHSEPLSSLREIISPLRNESGIAKKKAALFQKAIDLFISKECSFKLEAFRLQDQSRFQLVSTSTKDWAKASLPSYFEDQFEAMFPLNLESTLAFYDYQPTAPDVEDVWVDFANASLGGGCFGTGFVQEEIMVVEMPDFAAHIAGHIYSNKGHSVSIRSANAKNRDRAMQGSPQPYLIKGVHRVQAINNGLAYGRKIENISEEQLLDSTTALAVPQEVNVLALAAPRLFSKRAVEQLSPFTLTDNFNTLMAGFALAKEQFINPLVHSGRIGCGVFNNDIHAIYLLHCLAAQHVGVRVKLHGYSAEEAGQFQKSWDEVAPLLKGKTLRECMNVISTHLINRPKAG